MVNKTAKQTQCQAVVSTSSVHSREGNKLIIALLKENMGPFETGHVTS